MHFLHYVFGMGSASPCDLAPQSLSLMRLWLIKVVPSPFSHQSPAAFNNALTLAAGQRHATLGLYTNKLTQSVLHESAQNTVHRVCFNI